MEKQLGQDVELEKTQQEIEKEARKEEVRLRRAEQYECRTKEKEEKKGKDALEDIEVESTLKGNASSVRVSENPEKSKPVKPRNTLGKKAKTEVEAVPEVEEDEDEEELDETTMKKKIIGCINKEEVAAFQDYVRSKMIVLGEKLRANKNTIQPVREFIRSLKLEYDNLGLLKNNGVAYIEEIVQTATDTKGIAWRKFLEGKEILDAGDYSTIIEATIRSHLFQEGHLHDKIDEQILGPETEETRAEIM